MDLLKFHVLLNVVKLGEELTTVRGSQLQFRQYQPSMHMVIDLSPEEVKIFLILVE